MNTKRCQLAHCHISTSAVSAQWIFPLVAVRTASLVAAAANILTAAGGSGQVHGGLSGFQGFHRNSAEVRQEADAASK